MVFVLTRGDVELEKWRVCELGGGVVEKNDASPMEPQSSDWMCCVTLSTWAPVVVGSLNSSVAALGEEITSSMTKEDPSDEHSGGADPQEGGEGTDDAVSQKSKSAGLPVPLAFGGVKLHCGGAGSSGFEGSHALNPGNRPDLIHRDEVPDLSEIGDSDAP